MKLHVSLLIQTVFLFSLSSSQLADVFQSNSVETDYRSQRVAQRHPVRNVGIADDPNHLQYAGARNRGEGVFDDRSRIDAMSRAHQRQVAMGGRGGFMNRAGGMMRGGNDRDDLMNRMGRMGRNSGAMRGAGTGAGAASRMGGRGRGGSLVNRMQNAIGGAYMNRRDGNVNDIYNNDDELDDRYRLNADNHMEYQKNLRNYLVNRNGKMRGGAARGERGMSHFMDNVNDRMKAHEQNNGANSQQEEQGIGEGEEEEGGDDVVGGVLERVEGANSMNGDGGIQDQLSNEMNRVRSMKEEFDAQIDRSKINGKYYMNPLQVKQARLAEKQYKKIRDKEEETGVRDFSFGKYHGVGGMRANHLRTKEELNNRQKAAQKLKQMTGKDD